MVVTIIECSFIVHSINIIAMVLYKFEFQYKYSSFIRLQTYEQISYRDKVWQILHTQVALDFKLILKVITRNGVFQKKFFVI